MKQFLKSITGELPNVALILCIFLALLLSACAPRVPHGYTAHDIPIASELYVQHIIKKRAIFDAGRDMEKRIMLAAEPAKHIPAFSLGGE